MSDASYDLIENPIYRSEDLGKPMPSTPHAVSVALPLWSDVIGYEEKDPEVINRLTCGYPRFFIHPLIQKLIDQVQIRICKHEEKCILLPSESVAKDCIDYVSIKAKDIKKTSSTLRIEEVFEGIFAVVFHESLLESVIFFWRYSGEIISSRQAEDLINGQIANYQAGIESSHAIKKQIGSLYHIDPEDVYLYPSGIATSYAALKLLQIKFPKLKTCQICFPYVDVFRVQREFNNGAHFFTDTEDLSPVTDLLKKEKLAGVFTEFASNPLLDCVDLPALSAILKEAGVPLIIDDTITTVINSNAFAYADVATTSLTKFYSGSCDVIAGSLMLNPKSPFYKEFKQILNENYKNTLYPSDAVVLERNGRDFEERVIKINESTKELCNYLAKRPEIDEVLYPFFKSSENYRKSIKKNAGGSGVFSILLKNPETASAKFYDAIEISKGPSLGTNFTICCPFTLMAHYDELEWVESVGVSRYLIRVSVGLEDCQELIKRFTKALDAIEK